MKAYCTIVAANYLPQAYALAQSLAGQGDDSELHICVVDAETDDQFPFWPSNARLMTMYDLGLPEGEVDVLRMIYDVVELSTSVKPLVLTQLLRASPKAIYLDPDMWLETPLIELDALLDDHAIVLTPHILHPIPPGTSFISEGSSLTVGIHNLGFCAVNAHAVEFLAWWWAHLRRECLIYPLLGLFVDQKWMDMGAVLFSAHSLRHDGYNIGHWNLHERQFVRDLETQALVMESSSSPVRLLHFSGFNPEDPLAISVRQNDDLRDKGLSFAAYEQVSTRYAHVLLAHRQSLGPPPAYRFATDTTGRRISQRLRRVYRAQELRGERQPSAFRARDAADFARWRRRAVLAGIANSLPDAAMALKYAFPDTFSRVKSYTPGAALLRRRLLDNARVRR